MNARHTLALLVVLAGCTHLRLQESFITKPTDWTMFGGDTARTNNTHAVVTPPLHRVWEYGAGAGFGPTSPAIVDARIFVPNLQGEIEVVDLATGKNEGTFDFGSAIAATPAVGNGLLYIALAHDEESVVCYEVQNGLKRWRANVGDIETAPLLYGQVLYVTTLTGRLVALNTFDGTERWSFAVPAGKGPAGIHSSPATDGTCVFFGCDDGKVYAVTTDRGELRWSAATGAAVVATPAVDAARVYVGSLDGTFYAFDAASGAVAWKTDLGAKLYAAEAVGDTTVFVGTTGRAVVALDARTGVVRWRTTVGGIVNAAPLLCGPTLYVGAADHVLYALQTASGTIVATDTLQGRIKTTPVSWGHYLVVLAEDHSVVAFKEGPR